MTTETENASLLIRDLAAAFIEHPDKLAVYPVGPTDGTTYFNLRGCAVDNMVLVGKHGCHVDALAHLVARFGEAEGARWIYSLDTRGFRYERPFQVPRETTSYDPKPMCDLLYRIVESLDIGEFNVTVGTVSGNLRLLFFVFEIAVKDADDAGELLKSRRLVTREATEEKEERVIEMSDIEAIGTLFRAVAKSKGVRFQVNVAQP